MAGTMLPITLEWPCVAVAVSGVSCANHGVLGLYEVPYPRETSLGGENGKGAVFVEWGRALKRYPSTASPQWVPGKSGDALTALAGVIPRTYQLQLRMGHRMVDRAGGKKHCGEVLIERIKSHVSVMRH
jgi:hypothetical protein